MTLVMTESFDVLPSLSAARWGIQSGSLNVVTTPTPRTGPRCASNVNSNTSGPGRVLPAVAQALTWYVGCALHKNVANRTIGLHLCTDSGSNIQLTVLINVNGQIEVRRGNLTGTLLATGIHPALGLDAWWYVELGATISTSAGVIEVRVDGVPVQLQNAATSAIGTQLTGLNTRAVGTTNPLDSIRLAANGSGCFYDDMYVATPSGSVNNTFLGACKVEALIPNGAGSYSQWTPDAGANYTNVDEYPPATDKVASDGINTIDSYQFTDLVSPSAASVRGVIPVLLAQKSDTGGKSIRPRHKNAANGAENAGANIALTQTYTAYDSTVWENNPGTGAPWTVAEVNSSEFGVEAL